MRYSYIRAPEDNDRPGAAFGATKPTCASVSNFKASKFTCMALFSGVRGAAVRASCACAGSTASADQQEYKQQHYFARVGVRFRLIIITALMKTQLLVV